MHTPNNPSEAHLPSEETISAYLDGELAEADCQALEARMQSEPQLKALFEDFQALQAMGPAIDDRMPGDAYWQDLPDRVLARISAGDTTPAPAAQAPAPWWQRVLAPQSSWRWATATAVVAVVGAAVILKPDGSAPIPAELASNLSPADDIAATIDEAQPADLTSAYVKRMAMTYGTPGDIGTSLDVDPSKPTLVAGFEGPASPVTPVSFGHLPVPERRDPSTLMASSEPNRCTTADVFTAARICEERGNAVNAIEGYQHVRRVTTPSDPLHLAADLGLTRTTWRQKLIANRSDAVGTQTTLAQLKRQADTMYLLHQQGTHTDCERAWVLHLTLADLGQNLMTPEVHEEILTHFRDLSGCVK